MLTVSAAPCVGDATAGVVMVLVRWCCPRHADRECCAVWAMLLLVMRVLVCWCGPHHADCQCCAVVAMLLLVVMVLVRWGYPRQADHQGCAGCGRCYCWW
jgi:hypothetical protein